MLSSVPSDDLLNRAAKARFRGDAALHRHSTEVYIPVGGHHIAAALQVPESPKGLVLFAHGSGSSRHSPRNRFVADALHEGGLATMLLDLLTHEEEQIDRKTAHLRFDIGLLTQRLVTATHWAHGQPTLAALSCGYFGASTGSAAALEAAASLPHDISAVVSRGGRPDLAPRLADVRAATLLIVGGADPQTLHLNQKALRSMHTESELTVIPNATHLFEEPGALAEVAKLATSWFLRHRSVSTLSSR